VSPDPGDELRRLAEQVGVALRERGETLAVAESCTGGLIAARLTAVAGASDFFWGGVVVYTASAKVTLAGVGDATLREHGTVSAETTEELAMGVRARSGADYGLAVTGWAGPTAAPGAVVGEVYGAVALGGAVRLERWRFDGDRGLVRLQAARALLELLQGCLTAEQDGSDE